MTNPTLAVVCITQGKRPFMLAKTQGSVQAQNQMANWKVITAPTTTDWLNGLISACSMADLVCFVDDDDLVCNDSINVCYNAALANPTVGAFFTYEDVVKQDGTILGTGYRDNIRYFDIASHPLFGHHLCMFRGSMVDIPTVQATVSKTNCPADWLIRCNAGLRNGMMQIPIVGYKWTQDVDNRLSYNYGLNVDWQAARDATRSWITVPKFDKVPIYKL